MALSTHFFVKEGYHCNTQAQTFIIDQEDEYWTPNRIRISLRYQHYVYSLAARLARRRRFETGMDLGCGTGIKARDILSKHLRHLVLVDQPSSEIAVREMIADVVFISTDLEKCDLVVDKKMDLIVCADVLEHLHDPLPCLRFARNCLKPSGIAVFSTPERDILRGPSCMSSPHPSHVREWNTAEFRQLLEFSGFIVLKQLHLPPEKLSKFADLIRICFQRAVKKQPLWSGCQVAVCCKRDDLF
jgi:SAM-dependent methyltransferase